MNKALSSSKEDKAFFCLVNIEIILRIFMVQFNGFPPASGSRFYFSLCEKIRLGASVENERLIESGGSIECAIAFTLECVKAVARGTITYWVQPWFGYGGVLYNFGCALGKVGLGGWTLMFRERPAGPYAYDAVKHLLYGTADLVTQSLPVVSAVVHALVPNKIEELYKVIDELFPREDRNVVVVV